MADIVPNAGNALPKNDPVYHLNPAAQARSARSAHIVVVRGPQAGSVLPLTSGVNLFGRIEGTLIRDVLASRRHAQVYFIGSGYVLEDLQSTNGTFLNGSQISQPVLLKHGDHIRIGETLLVFELKKEKTSVLGYGAAPDSSADHSVDEPTMNIYKISTAEFRRQKSLSNPA